MRPGWVNLIDASSGDSVDWLFYLGARYGQIERELELGLVMQARFTIPVQILKAVLAASKHFGWKRSIASQNEEIGYLDIVFTKEPCPAS